MKQLLTLLFACTTFTGAIGQMYVIDLLNMNESRSGHQLVALTDGRALAVGGTDGNATLSSAEVFENDLWTSVESMALARENFVALPTSDNQAVIMGGYDGDLTTHSSIAVYNGDFDTWTAGPNMSNPRSNHRAIVLDDGRMLITGGFNGSFETNSCDLFDPVGLTITSAAPMIHARSSHVLVKLLDGRIAALGGFNPDQNFQMVECEVYDPEQDSWSVLPNLSVGRDNLAAFLHPDGGLHVVGGRIFDAENNWFEGEASSERLSSGGSAWEAAGALDNGACYNDIFAMPGFDGLWLMLGGADVTSFGEAVSYGNNLVNNLGPDDWVFNDNFASNPRFRHAACQLAGGQVMVTGGDADGTAQLIGMMVGLEDAQRLSFQVSPNPVESVLRLVGTDIPESIILRDMHGRQLSAAQAGTRAIDLSDVPAGHYVLDCSTGTSRSFVRVVIR